ncbi:MAG TPA: RNA polymerase sigma factor [Tissierellaceae bacterium]
MNLKDAFTSYLIQVGKEVFLVLRSKGASKEDAEDIIQNTFYKIYSMLSDLDEKTVRPWFYRVALNEFIDLKRKKFQHNVPLSDEIQSKLTSKDADFEQFFNQDEILSLLKNVKTEYREIFVLKYYYEFSYEEIAQLLNMQVANVKQKLYRARKTIRSEAGGIMAWIQRFKKH